MRADLASIVARPAGLEPATPGFEALWRVYILVFASRLPFGIERRLGVHDQPVYRLVSIGLFSVSYTHLTLPTICSV